jgi:Polysulphide reductase
MRSETLTPTGKPWGGPNFLLVAGSMLWLCSWGYQLLQGMKVTGINQQVPWGMYIAAFFAAAGAGAGVIVVATLAERKCWWPVELVNKALLLALTAFMSAGILITMDIGNPLAIIHMVFSFRLHSLMVWDFYLLMLILALTASILFLGPNCRNRGLLLVSASAVAVALICIEAAMLASAVAHPLWAQMATYLSFLLAAAVAGLSLALLVLPGADSGVLRRALGWTLFLSLVSLVAEFLNSGFAATPESLHELRLYLSGSQGVLLVLYLVLGLVVPLTLLSSHSQVRVVTGLALLGVLCEKLWFLSAGQVQPALPLAQGAYSITLVEGAAVVGVLAVWGLLYATLGRILCRTVA